MNDAVIPELELLVFSVLSGAVCFLGYDVLLVLRIFLKRAVLFEKIEDILYWLAASVLVFSIIYEKNGGIIRGYFIAGMISGMILYRAVAKDRLTQMAARRANCIKKWFQKKFEPLQKKKKELQNKRKQSKMEKREQKKSRRQSLGQGKKKKKKKKRKKKGLLT